MSKCERCKKYDDCRKGSGIVGPCGAYVPKVVTNADRIRAMSDEELAEFFCPDKPHNSPWCEPVGKVKCGKAPCRKCMMDWLQQPAEEGAP